MTHRIITIDGPAGAGKTTISKQIAQSLGCVYVDTGALYRGVAYEIKRLNVDWEDDQDLADFLGELSLDFTLENSGLKLSASGRDITSHIRTPEISMLASATSAKPQVRAALLNMQKEIARTRDAVFEGRDMGTTVFPEAQFKFFLDADLSVRAKRRYEEMKESDKNFTQVEKEMSKRDLDDAQRETSPLRPADDAIRIDSSRMDISQVVAAILSHIKT